MTVKNRFGALKIPAYKAFIRAIWIPFLFGTFLGLPSCKKSSLEDQDPPRGEGLARLGAKAVAEIDGTKIYLADIERTAVAQGLIEPGIKLSPDDPIFQKVLDEKIDQRLLALEALKRALDQQEETRRRLSEARERILASILVEKHLSERVTDTTVRRIYDEQALLSDRGAERRVRQIVVEDQEAAQDVQTRLDAGESFAAVARDVSIDADTKAEGGALGFISRDMIDPDLTRVIFATDIGDIAEPLELGGKFYILKVEDRRRPAQAPFEQLEPEIREFMIYEEMQKMLRNLRKNGEVKLLYGSGQAGRRAAKDLDSDADPALELDTDASNETDTDMVSKADANNEQDDK